MYFAGGFARAVEELKRDPLVYRKTAERFRDSEPAMGTGWKNLLSFELGFSCCGVPAAKLEEIAPILLGFDESQCRILKAEAKALELIDRTLDLGKKTILDLQKLHKRFPNYVLEEDPLYKKIKQNEEESLQDRTWFLCFAECVCKQMELIFEMYRRSAEAGEAVYCGEWLGSETIVRPGEFFKWAEDQGFPLPDEATQTISREEVEQTKSRDETEQEEPDREPQAEEISPKDFAERELAQGKALGQVMLALYENYKGMTHWKAAALALRIPIVGLGYEDREKLRKKFKRHTEKFKA